MTSAIMNPLHPEIVTAIMGADVMMGHDPDCMRWIRRFREAPPAQGPAGAAPGEGAARGRREGGHRRRVSSEQPTRSSSSRLPESADAFRSAHRCCRRRASLGVDIDSVCGGRAICGRCQVLVMEGEFAKHGVSSRSGNLSAPSAAEESYGRRRTLAAGNRLSCQARIEGDLVVDVPPGSQVHRQVIRKAAEARAITLDPVVRLHYVEVREPDMHDPAGDLQRLEGGAAARVGADRPRLRPAGAAAAAAGAAQGGVEGHGRGSRRRADRGHLAGLSRAGARPCGRHRLHHHRRSPVRPRVGRGARLERRHEPADPLRRGSDEPRLLLHDASGRRAADDGGGARRP